MNLNITVPFNAAEGCTFTKEITKLPALGTTFTICGTPVVKEPPETNTTTVLFAVQ